MSQMINDTNNEFVVFGEDENLTCLLVKDNQCAIFEALLYIRKEHRSFKYKKKYAVSKNQIILVLCRTMSIEKSVEALTQISEELISTRKKQATDAGWINYVVKVINDEHAMIYY